MSFLSTTHAAFISISSSQHPDIAGTRQHHSASVDDARGKLRSQSSSSLSSSAALLFMPPSPALASSLACLMQSVAFRDGTLEVTRTVHSGSTPAGTEKKNAETNEKKKLSIFYRIFRPMNLSSFKAAPILVLHGGPSVPSDYLYPLVDHIPYRSIVFYDQIGCGNSSEPKDVNAYSISKGVDDLERLISKLGLRRFHLYGQSFGGILAFEYLKRIAERMGADAVDQGEDHGCLSLVLSSTPTDVKEVEDEAQRLLDDLLEEDGNEESLGERFRRRHQCRTKEMPVPLSNAYAYAGTVWRGTTAIPNYTARSPSPGAARMPSCMVLRGEHDFVTEKCVLGWKDVFNHKFVREKVLDGCGHHGLLENGQLYGEVLESFFSEYD